MYFLGKHRENCFKMQLSKEKINTMKKFRLLKKKEKIQLNSTLYKVIQVESQA